MLRAIERSRQRKAEEEAAAAGTTPAAPPPIPAAAIPETATPKQIETIAAVTTPPGRTPDFNVFTNNPNLDRPELRAQLTDMARDYPQDPAVSGLAGAAAFQQGDFKSAARLLDAPVAANPDNADLLYLRGATKLNLGRHEDAAEDLQAALQLDPNLTQAGDLLHLIRKKVPESTAPVRPERSAPKEKDGVPAGFSAAVQAALADRRPSPTAAALMREADSKRRVGDAKGELDSLRRAAAADPGHPAAALRLGEAALRAGRPEEAERAADAVLAKVAGHAGALNIRGTAKARRADFKGALADAEAALAGEPDSALGHWVKAFALSGLDRRREAAESLREAAVLDRRFVVVSEGYEALPPDADPLIAFGSAKPGPGVAAAPPPSAPASSLRGRAGPLLGAAGAALVAFGLLVLYRRRGDLGRQSVPRWSGPPAAEPPLPAEASPEAHSGASFGPGALLAGVYRVERELGRGTMGVVLKAQDMTLRRPVAIKTLRGYARGNPEAAARLLREAQLSAALKHPNIVPVLTASAHGDDVLLVFEYVEARALSDVLEDFHHLPLADAIRILRQVASALDHAHQRRVIHRDLKPANILVTADGTALVTDFGLAHEASASAWRETSAPGWGSPAYMAPEQESGKVSAASDVYALGGCFYEMLTGVPPFPGPECRDLKRRGEFSPPSSRRAGLPEAVDAAVSRALDPLPERRYRTAGEFAAALAPLVGV